MGRQFSDSEITRHNALCNQASQLQKGLIWLDGHQISKPGFFARRKLRKSIALYEEALKINPDSWQSMTFVGKAFQALNRLEEALTWFKSALSLDPNNPVIAKEAGGTAGLLGKHDLAVQIMTPVALTDPNDVVLQTNLGLSCMLSGKTLEASNAFETVYRLEPQRPMNARLAAFAKKVHLGEEPIPKTEAELLKRI
jgi:tetratricopeptide (TPR) repeat protein